MGHLFLRLFSESSIPSYLTNKVVCSVLKAVRKPPKCIRGGITVCFPQVGYQRDHPNCLPFDLEIICVELCLSIQMQFGNVGLPEQNGFARNRLWSLDGDSSPLSPSNSQSSVDLILKPTEEDARIWPRRYACALV